MFWVPTGCSGRGSTCSPSPSRQAELEDLFREPRVLDMDLLLYIVTREKAFHLQQQQPDTIAELFDVLTPYPCLHPPTVSVPGGGGGRGRGGGGGGADSLGDP